MKYHPLEPNIDNLYAPHQNGLLKELKDKSVKMFRSSLSRTEPWTDLALCENVTPNLMFCYQVIHWDN